MDKDTLSDHKILSPFGLHFLTLILLCFVKDLTEK